MVRILIIGDLHAPNRAKDCPEQIYSKINELSETELFDYTLFTGDLVKFPEFIEFLDSKTKNKLFIVMGNMDYHYGNHDAPIYESIDIIFEDNEKMIIGLTHGAQISPRGDHEQLEILANKKNYNVLISGHTHKEEIFLTNNGILLINPGSVTGAWSFVASGIPSFVELQINKKTKEINVDLIQIDKQSRDIIVVMSSFFFRNNQIIKKI
ncbi:MAG: YfcE family phosphodiesterase [Candidatus Lokiarchaeota archaeon]|nr:YfcE family phosphodiesterase [Candidatus Lokiarchaeota archaeon]